MADVEKVIKGWERCKECQKAPALGINQAYIDCEYTVGLYCGQDRLINETIEVLKSQKEEIERLKAHNPDCDNAEHDSGGCLGYGRNEQDDEPIDACKKCEKYTGKEGEQDG